MRQRKKLELMKDYDLTISYHPGKANVKVDALSRKSLNNIAAMITSRKPILEDSRRMELQIALQSNSISLANFVVLRTLLERIKVI